MQKLSPFNHIEDDKEHQNIRNNITCTSHCIKSIDELEKTVFIPFDSDIGSHSQLMDLDPDVQYFNASNVFTDGESKYYFEDSINAETQSHNIQSAHFSLIHLLSEVLIKCKYIFNFFTKY